MAEVGTRIGTENPPAHTCVGQGEELDPDAIKDWPFSGDYQKENALSALGGALLLGASMEDLQRRLSLLQPLEMRMQLHGAKDGGYLLEDTYSSDLSGPLGVGRARKQCTHFKKMGGAQPSR